MSKISDNASDGSFGHQQSNEINGSGSLGQHKKKKKNTNINLKKGPMAT
jgi:hypothetical protein